MNDGHSPCHQPAPLFTKLPADQHPDRDVYDVHFGALTIARVEVPKDMDRAAVKLLRHKIDRLFQSLEATAADA